MDIGLLIAIISPISVTVGGLISWLIKSKREEILAQEEKAREFRLKTYAELLDPFIAALTFTIPQKQKERGINKIKSIEYRKAAFNLMTFGSDEVIKSYNNLMQSFFTTSREDFKNDEEYGVVMLKKFSDFLMKIRKDLYSKNTKLKRSELIEFMITDIDKHRKEIDQ